MWKAGACNERGFTLVELAMVLLVLGIVGAVAMPRVSGMLDRQRMRHTINVVRGTVRYVQARAALTKRVYRLTFDVERQTMSACYVSVDACQPEPSRELRVFTFPPAARLLDVIRPDGEKTVEGEAITHFHPTGLAEPSTLHLTNSIDERITLMITPLGGRIKVLPGYVEPETRS
jgi:general secretion pathway protein H